MRPTLGSLPQRDPTPRASRQRLDECHRGLDQRSRDVAPSGLQQTAVASSFVRASQRVSGIGQIKKRGATQRFSPVRSPRGPFNCLRSPPGQFGERAWCGESRCRALCDARCRDFNASKRERKGGPALGKQAEAMLGRLGMVARQASPQPLLRKGTAIPSLNHD